MHPSACQLSCSLSRAYAAQQTFTAPIGPQSVPRRCDPCAHTREWRHRGLAYQVAEGTGPGRMTG